MKNDLSDETPSKRILLLLTGCFTSAGGMYEYTKAWFAHLQNRDWNTHVATLFHINEIFLSQERNKVLKFTPWLQRRYQYWELVLSSFFKVPPYSTLVRNISAVIDEEKHKAVHIMDIALFSGTLLLDLAKRHRETLFVITIHDPRSHEERISTLSRLLLTSNTRKLIAASKQSNVRVHVHSLHLLEHSAYAEAGNIIVMPHPLPRCTATRNRERVFDDKYESIAVGKNRPRGKIRLGFMGRIEEYKGLDVFFRAMKDLLEKRPPLADKIEILIAGRGPIADDWASLPCRVEISNGFIDDLQFHQHMADLDVLILPYKTATQSGVGMMGVAYGIPLIATQTGCIEGTVVNNGYNGLVVPAGDATGLADAISKLVYDPDFFRRITINAIEYSNRLQR